MTVVEISHAPHLLYIGLSTDTKPAAPELGSRFIEHDSDEEYIWDGTAWREIDRVSIAYEHKQIHRGIMWSISHLWVDVANEAYADLLVTAPATGLHVIYAASAEGKGYLSIHEPADVSGGTAATVTNANRNTGDSGAPTVVHTPTVNDAGTLLRRELMPAGTGGNAPGFAVDRQTELVLAPSTAYLFRVQNMKGNASDISWLLLGYEHD